MNPMMFPKMLISHAEGWDWLAHTHPSITRMYLIYVVPMSLIPPAMLVHAWYAYSEAPLLDISLNQILLISSVFFIAELIMVPIMGWVVQQIGAVADAYPPYRNTFALAAIAPTPLWLAPLALFIPSLLFNVLAILIAVAGVVALIYQGVDRTFNLQDEGRTVLVAGSVLGAGLVAWVMMIVVAFVTWGIVLS